MVKLSLCTVDLYLLKNLPVDISSSNDDPAHGHRPKGPKVWV